MSKPVLAVTLGDVAGIGPEITARTLLGHPHLRERCVPVVIGDEAALRSGARVAGLDPGAVRAIREPSQATNDPATLEVVQTGPSLAHVPPGEIHPDAGEGAYRFVVAACDLARAGKVSGIVTAPLNKAALHAAGHEYPGHTELLAERFGVEEYSLVLSAGDLYFFHLTTHVPLRRAIELITRERTTSVIDLAAAFCRALGRPGEPIAVAGLNPHAGENRLFGDEEADILAPAIEAARARGIPVTGPLPGDVVIPQAVRGKWNVVVCCYHDQGHAPFKAVYGEEGVNITVGLPVVRVSVDHGTAFDIAGRGIAREASLVLAMERAAVLSPGWHEVWNTAKEGLA
jgi:4-hydroxythreonine-4-phosphate dehydrogenase